MSDAPTFAQLGTHHENHRQQQHRAVIEQSKYLGGDVEHTHLVKGLDFALLKKVRAEQEAAEAAKAKKADEASAKQTVARRAQLLPTRKDKTGAPLLPASMALA